MNKIILTIMASLLSCSAAQAFWPEASDSSLEIGVGFRQDRVKWKTSENCSYGSATGDCENFPALERSSLEWKNINIWEVEARGYYVTCDRVYLRGSADYGWITSGKARSKPFGGYGTSLVGASEYGDSSSKVRGHVYDVKFALGYQFQLCDDTFSISPLIGYSWHGQHFKDKNRGYSCGYDTAPALYHGSSSYSYSDYSYSSDYSYDEDRRSYHTRWNGPFLGFDFDYSLCCEWDLFGGYEFHWAQYHAKGRWDGIGYDYNNGFYQHAKNAYGQVFDIGVKWDLCDCWTLALRGEFQFWNAHHGKDRTKVLEASCTKRKLKTFVEVPVKKIEWRSGSVVFDVGMVF